MKIRKKNLFSPVVITIEKKLEADRLVEFFEEAFGRIQDQHKSSSKYDLPREILMQLRYATNEETEE